MNVLRFNFLNEENRNNASNIFMNEGYIIQNTNPEPGSYLMNIYIPEDSDRKGPDTSTEDTEDSVEDIEVVE